MSNLTKNTYKIGPQIENIAEYVESLRQKHYEGVPIKPTLRLIHNIPQPQPIVKKGLGPRIKKQLIKELSMPGSKKLSEIDPRFFKLDLRKEKYSDYQGGMLTILKRCDHVNHALFQLGADMWLERKDYLREDEILCYLVDRNDWHIVTGAVVIELAESVFEAGKIIDNILTIDNTLTIHRRNPDHNFIQYNPADIVKIWKIKTLVGRDVF